jgi:hypothetical protein
MYGISFFSLSKIKIGVFLALSIGYFGLEFLRIIKYESVYVADKTQFVLSLIFFLVVFYVIAAVLEFIYYKVR